MRRRTTRIPLTRRRRAFPRTNAGSLRSSLLFSGRLSGPREQGTRRNFRSFVAAKRSFYDLSPEEKAQFQHKYDTELKRLQNPVPSFNGTWMGSKPPSKGGSRYPLPGPASTASNAMVSKASRDIMSDVLAGYGGWYGGTHYLLPAVAARYAAPLVDDLVNWGGRVVADAGSYVGSGLMDAFRQVGSNNPDRAVGRRDTFVDYVPGMH